MMASHPKSMRRRCPRAINDKTATDIIVNGFISPAPALEKKCYRTSLKFFQNTKPRSFKKRGFHN
jgi:hypothetical protein